MSQDTQEPAGGKPTQRTEKGLEIPVPKRSDVMDAFKKVLRPKPKR